VGEATFDVSFTEFDRSLERSPRAQLRFDETLPVGATLAFDATTTGSFGQGISARSWGPSSNRTRSRSTSDANRHGALAVAA